MKKLSFLSLILIFAFSSIEGMQQSNQPQTAPVLSVRARLYNAIFTAISNDPIPLLTSDDQLPEELKTASPQSFYKIMRALRFAKLQELFRDEKGITPEMIEQIKEQSRQKLQPFKLLPPASAHVQKIVAEATENMPGTPLQVVCDNNSEHIACVSNNRMIVNETKLRDLNITPQKLSAVARHERTHADEHDNQIKSAYLQALRQQKGSRILTPQSHNLFLFLSRFKEIFADLRGSSGSIVNAQESARMSQHMVNMYGEGKSYNHPSNGQRSHIDQLMVEFHNEYYPRKKRSKRSLRDEFDEVAKEELSPGSARSWVDDDGHVKVRIKRIRNAQPATSASSSSSSSLQK